MTENYKNYAIALGAQTKVIKWIDHNLSNFLKNNPENQDEIEHILDYLISDEAPVNIEKMSYDEAKKNADSWTKKLIKKGEHIKELATDIETVLDFNDGFKIVKLIGRNAYEREGYLMRHCVASYYGTQKEIYSLRDKDNMPHCTMEKNQQVKGKGNGNIHPKYVGYIVKFLEYVGMTVGDSEMAHLGYINVEKFKNQLSKETTYFNGKYVPESEKLIDTQGNEYASLDLLDIKPLVKESFDGEIKINFDLRHFLGLSIGLLMKISKKKEVGVIVDAGYSAKIGSSGDSAQIGSSGDSAQIGSSGDSAKIGSSGDSAKIGSSGDYAQIGSSGDSAKIGSSGDYAQIGSSGYYAQIGSSGYYAQIGSSGYSAKIGSSGDSAQIGSSGDSAKIGSSGGSAKIGSSGGSAKIGSSGDSAKIGSSGNYAQIGSSGGYAQIELNGEYGVAANIGIKGKIKGKKGNWITLAEYDDDRKPICVKSIQIDGEKIKEDIWYMLKGGEFVEVK